MKKIIALLILTGFTAASCNQSDKTAEKEKEQKKDTVIKTDTVILSDQTNQVTGTELDFLRNYAGKYPNDVKLLDNSVLRPRLEKLLGGRFAFVKETWAVEGPMEVKNDMFIASACQAHNCGSTNFIIVADLAKNILYAGVREEEKVKVYSEDGSSNAEIQKWVSGN